MTEKTLEQCTKEECVERIEKILGMGKGSILGATIKIGDKIVWHVYDEKERE